MKKFTYCFILLLCSFYINAQSNLKLDSLKKVLAKLPKEGASFAGDTTRVKVLVEMGEMFENFDSAKIVFNNAVEISQRNSWQNGIYLSNYHLGIKASNIGYDFLAIDSYFKALGAAEKSKRPQLTGITYRRLGDEYLIVEDFSKAEFYYKKALADLSKTTNKKAYLMSLNNLGLVLYNRRQYKEAIRYFEDCLIENKIIGDKVFDTFCIGNIAACYRGLGNYDKSLNYYIQNQAIGNTIVDFPLSDRVYTIIQIAELYYLKKDYFKANIEIIKAEEYINSVNTYTQTYLYQIAYKTYKALGNSMTALKYHELYINLKEMSSKQDYKKRLDALQFEYDNEKQKANIVILNKENEKKNLVQKILWSGLGLVLLFVGIQFWNNRILKNKNIQIEFQKNEITELNQGLEQKIFDRTKALSDANEELLRKNDEIMLALVEGQTIERKRVAVELHDNLGSMLSSMKWRLQALNKDKLSEKEQKVYEGILSMMGDAYTEVRLISHNLLPAELEKNGLIGALQKLCDDINQSERIYFTLNTDKIKITNKKTEIELYSICLELINNILKHSQATEVDIKINKVKDNLVITLNDNGIGVKNKNQTDGIGLKNIQNRLLTISGKIYNNEVERGTEFLIETPMIV